MLSSVLLWSRLSEYHTSVFKILLVSFVLLLAWMYEKIIKWCNIFYPICINARRNTQGYLSIQKWKVALLKSLKNLWFFLVCLWKPVLNETCSIISVCQDVMMHDGITLNPPLINPLGTTGLLTPFLIGFISCNVHLFRQL